MRPSAITSIPARRRITVIITAIVIVLAACIPDALKAQSPLPVKDFSVGSQYTYRTTSGTFTEVVLRDTTALGRTYGVVQTFGVIKYLRSDTSSIYEYDPRSNRESTVFQLGQTCATSPGMGWFPQDSACTQVFRTPTQIRYGRYEFRYLSNNIDTYSGRFVGYMKPFGFISYYGQSCGPMYSAGHITRPPEQSGAGWYQICALQTIAELTGAALGQKIPAQLGLNFAPTTTANYGDRVELSVGLEGVSDYAKFVGLPNRAELQFTIDTADIDSLLISTPDSFQPRTLYPVGIQQGKAIIQLSLQVSRPDYLCTISFRSRAIQQRQQQFTGEIRGAFSSFTVQPLTATLTHGGVKRFTIALAGFTFPPTQTQPDSTLKYGEIKRIYFELIQGHADFNWRLIDSVLMRIKVEDAGLDSIEIFARDRRPVRSVISSAGQSKNYDIMMSPLGIGENSGLLGIFSVRSISQAKRKNRFTFQVLSGNPVFSFIPSDYVLEQSGQKLFVSAGPNPAQDKVSLTFAPEDSGTVTLSLLDIKGSVVKRKEIRYTPGFLLADMNTSDIQPGMYFLQAIFSNGATGSYKIMVAR